jgi:hypothetical protein
MPPKEVNMAATCVVDDCVARDAHTDNCPNQDECGGCAPALAAPGRHVCDRHEHRTRDGIHQLADIWEALGQQPTSGGLAHLGHGADEPPQPLGDNRRQAREAIRNILITWCRILAEPVQHGGNNITLPDERTIAVRTRRAALDAQEASEAELTGYHRARKAKDEDGRPDEHARALAPHHLNRASQHSHQAAALRNRRETGADIIDGLAHHLDRHLDWLLNSDHADQLVHDIANLVACRGLAYAGRPAPSVRCSCGERVAMNVDPTDTEQIYECRGCGAWGVMTWWINREGVPEGQPMKLSELPDWLWIYHAMPVTLSQLRNWARTRTVPGRHVDGCERQGCDGCLRTTPAIEPVIGGEAAPGETALYDPHAVARVAQSRLIRTAKVEGLAS